MKACSKCSDVKPLSEYARDARRPDGIRSECKACKAVVQRQNYERNRAKRNADSRAAYAANADARRAYAKEYREANRESVDARRLAFRQANRARLAAASLDWYYSSPENRQRVVERNKAWRAANARRAAELSKAKTAARRARLKGATTHRITDRDLRRLIASPCAVAGCTNSDITIDHIVPLMRGGSHGIGNLQPLCLSHNASKGTKLWIEFRTIHLRRLAHSA